MEIVRYFATLGIKVSKTDVRAVDGFLNKLEKDLKTNVKTTGELEKAVKKETKVAVDGLVQKEQKQKALSQQVLVTAKNQKAWNKEFAYSLKMMTSATKPLGKAALKNQQNMYDQLFGAISPRAAISVTGANQKAWNTRFKQQIASMTATGSISRRARQDELNSAFGAVGSNPLLANILNQRLSHLGGGRSDTLSDMAAHYLNEEKVAALRARMARQEEESTRKILALRQGELLREERTRQRMAKHEVKEAKKAEKAEKAAVNQRKLVEKQARIQQSISRGNYMGLGAGSYGGAGHSFAAYSGGILSNRLGVGYGVIPTRALAAATPFAAGLAVQQGSVALGNNQALREMQRTQLDVASSESSRYGRDFANSRFFGLSNQLGVNAESLIEPYAKFMKQMTTMGRTPDQGFELFRDMSFATRAAGGGQQQMERQAFALQQILGLGHLRAEELNLQLSDANPAVKGYIMREYAKRTGDASGEGFTKALSNRQVSIEDVLNAYRTAAMTGQGRVQELSSTVQAEQARLANAMLEEQMARTLDEEVIPAMREYVQAQKEMYEAMKPFRDSMYEAAASVLSFSAAAMKFVAPYVNTLGEKTRDMPAINSLATNPLWFVPDSPLTMPLKYASMAYSAASAKPPQVDPSQSRVDFLRKSKESFQFGSQQSGSTQVLVQPGAFVISTQASDPEEVGKLTTAWFKRELEQTMQAYPNTGG